MSSIPTEPREYGDHDLPLLIQRATEPIVLESHYAGWNAPWRGLSVEAWKELAREFGERVNGALIETGRNRELAVRYGLEIVPAVLVFSAGEVVARFTGSVRVVDVIDAVHAGLRQARNVESAKRELEAVSASKRTLSPVRSLLRRRANEVSELAFAG